MPIARLTRRRALAAGGALVVLIALALTAPLGRADPASDQAQKFIEGLADKAVAALTDPKVPRAERETRARVLLNDNFAVATIGQWVLGRYWRSAAPQEKQEYLALFEDLIVTTYVDRFTRYAGEKLSVIGASAADSGGDVIVSSQINRPGSQPVDVGWRVRTKDGTSKVVDVYVEGVSMGQTQRSEFGSIIQNNGGQISALLEEMRRRLQRAS
jgi:phospholipid transport system substrate-binding protein